MVGRRRPGCLRDQRGGPDPQPADRAAAREDPDLTCILQLTGREIEVLELLTRGLTNRAISARLYLSDKTVRNHVSNILAKTGAPDRQAAADMARRAGLGTDPGR